MKRNHAYPKKNKQHFLHGVRLAAIDRCKQMKMKQVGLGVRPPHSLLAPSVPLAARQRHFHHAGGEGHPQRVALAVDLHADDALVLHAVDAAPGSRRERERRYRRSSYQGANCGGKRREKKNVSCAGEIDGGVYSKGIKK